MTPEESFAAFLQFGEVTDLDPDAVAGTLLSRVPTEDLEELQGAIADVLSDSAVAARQWQWEPGESWR